METRPKNHLLSPMAHASAAGLVCVLMLSACDRPSMENGGIPDDWVAERKQDGDTATFIRYNRGLIWYPKGGYTELLRITAEFPTKRADGFPDDAEAEILWRLEDTLEDRLADECLFAGTITVPHRRHFLFYSRSVSKSHAELETLVQEVKDLKIVVQASPDSSWQAFKKFHQPGSRTPSYQ